VKGVADPVPIYEVIGKGPLRTRLQVAERRGLTRFVGRDAELAQMRSALEAARQAHGQIVAVMGEPGVGKSRLFFEFKAVAQSGCLILEAYSVSHGRASAYLPVIELLRDYFRIIPEDDPRQRRQKVIGRVLELDRSFESILPYLFTLLGIQEGEDPLGRMDAKIRRQRTQDALKRIFIRESLNQPLIVVFEDLHWIDSDTQAILNLLADSIANARILLLVNYRPEYHHEWGQRTHYAQLRLDPLGKESAEEMLDALSLSPRRCGLRTRHAQTIHPGPHPGQSVLYRRDRAGLVRRRGADARWFRLEGRASAVTAAYSPDRSGRTRCTHRSAAGR
jgi:hypothetical protein